jgi:hypothetical protein
MTDTANLLARQVYRSTVPAVPALILQATRAARRARQADNPSARRFYTAQKAERLLTAASLALDPGLSAETLLRVAAVMAERCSQGVDVAEQVEAGQ